MLNFNRKSIHVLNNDRFKWIDRIRESLTYRLKRSKVDPLSAESGLNIRHENEFYCFQYFKGKKKRFRSETDHSCGRK